MVLYPDNPMEAKSVEVVFHCEGRNTPFSVFVGPNEVLRATIGDIIVFEYKNDEGNHEEKT